MNLLSEPTEEIYSLCPLHPLHTVDLLSEFTTTISRSECSGHAVDAVDTVVTQSTQ